MYDIKLSQGYMPLNDDISETATKAQSLMETIKESKIAKNIQGCIKAYKELSEYMGVAGSIAGFVFDLFGSGSSQTPDPELLKLEDMIKDTQILIMQGNQQVMEAIAKLNS